MPSWEGISFPERGISYDRQNFTVSQHQENAKFNVLDCASNVICGSKRTNELAKVISVQYCPVFGLTYGKSALAISNEQGH